MSLKIRGFTIEVAEIEVALLRLGSITEVVVVGREGRSGDLYLVAYIVPAIPSIPGVSQLRRTLAETLPTYMIPSSFVVLQALPRTPNGKVDRRALPAPTRSRPVLERAYVTPRTPIEEKLTCIWAELLDVEQVGIHDPFLELGGHSLLATQIIARVINIFRVDVPVRALMEASTVAEMSSLIVAHESSPGRIEKIAQVLQEVEAMSDDEVREALQ